MTTALTTYDQSNAPALDLMTLGNVLAQSTYFQDAKDAAQAIVKVLAGQELGIGPIAAMTGLYIVKGRVTMSANLMAAQIKRSGKYNYRTTEMSNVLVSITFYENGQEIGVSSFSADDAKQAGLWGSSEPWKKTPRNMLFARAMSNGCKWFCPDVFSGPVYTPDELPESSPVVLPPAPAASHVTGEIIEPDDTERRKALSVELKSTRAHARSIGVEIPALANGTNASVEDIEQCIDNTLNAMIDSVHQLMRDAEMREIAIDQMPDLPANLGNRSAAQLGFIGQKLIAMLSPVEAAAA